MFNCTSSNYFCSFLFFFFHNFICCHLVSFLPYFYSSCCFVICPFVGHCWCWSWTKIPIVFYPHFLQVSSLFWVLLPQLWLGQAHLAYWDIHLTILSRSDTNIKGHKIDKQLWFIPGIFSLLGRIQIFGVLNWYHALVNQSIFLLSITSFFLNWKYFRTLQSYFILDAGNDACECLEKHFQLKCWLSMPIITWKKVGKDLWKV